MATAYFNSLPPAEIVEVEFLAASGGTELLTLMVDSGFTGASGFVLPRDRLMSLGRVRVGNAQAAGALQGSQTRAWVVWRIPLFQTQQATIAIFSDVTPLALPPGVDGMVGLTFLRQFDGWGGERLNDGSWRFGLTIA